MSVADNTAGLRAFVTDLFTKESSRVPKASRIRKTKEDR